MSKSRIIIDVFITAIILYNQVIVIEKNMYSSYNEKRYETALR